MIYFSIPKSFVDWDLIAEFQLLAELKMMYSTYPTLTAHLLEFQTSDRQMASNADIFLVCVLSGIINRFMRHIVHAHSRLHRHCKDEYNRN